MHGITLLVLGVVLFVLLLIGGAIFMALEQTNESEVSRTAATAYTTFITDNACVSTANLSTFIKAILSAYDAGVISTADTSSESNWDFASSFFFSLTVVTSIGYGHISPATSGGQVFFVFYAIIGIPLCAVFLAGLGDKLGKLYKKLEDKTILPKYPKTEKALKMFSFNALCFVVFSLIPAVIFMVVEGWTYRESWYYTIVTLTTVGFGDYVPGQGSAFNREIYKILTMVWIFSGLAWLAMILNIAGDFFKSMTGKVDAKVKPKQDNDKQEDGTEKQEDASKKESQEVSV